MRSPHIAIPYEVNKRSLLSHETEPYLPTMINRSDHYSARAAKLQQMPTRADSVQAGTERRVLVRGMG
jgi:hypothetical protein